MNIDQAKAIPIFEILARLDVHPKHINGDRALYASPFRQERIPSFWVYIKTNSWFDYGEAVGGDVVDFACQYLKAMGEDHTIAAGLRWLNGLGLSEIIYPPVKFHSNTETITESLLSVRSEKSVKHKALIQYLHQRRLTLELAREHLREVLIENKATGKSFFALGFKNEEGGYELRNPFFKGSTKPKTISFIGTSNSLPSCVHVFEGFMDYLSVVTRFGSDYLNGDTIILNSTACLPKAYPLIQTSGYKVAYSWMDNDKAGDKTFRLLSKFIENQQDTQLVRMNHVYTPFKDVNEWHVATLGMS